VGRQLTAFSADPDLETADRRRRTHSNASGRRKRARPAEDGRQPELTPDPRRAIQVDEKAKAAQVVREWAEYRAEFPETDSTVRSRRHTVSIARSTREGDRPESIGSGSPTKRERQEMHLDLSYAIRTEERLGAPAAVSGCPTGPCWHVGCRHHVAIEVDGDVTKLNFPGRELRDMKETCTLRVANRGESKKGDPKEIGRPVMTCNEVGEILNLSPERIRQIETEALAKLKASLLRLIPELLER
jgi:hypothetical protein